jgi:hypothetical protein
VGVSGVVSQWFDYETLVSLGHLAVGLVLSLLLQWLYVKFGASLSNRKEFARIFPLICLTVIIVITVVKTSLALSLGLIGALSIVRFRTPIKEPEELAYLFIVIAIGLGLGADKIELTVAATLFIFVVIAALGAVKLRGKKTQNLYLSMNSAAGVADFDVEAVARAVAAEFPVCDIRRVDTSENTTRASFFVEVKDSERMFAFLKRFKTDYPQIDVSIVEQQRVPGV